MFKGIFGSHSLRSWLVIPLACVLVTASAYAAPHGGEGADDNASCASAAGSAPFAADRIARCQVPGVSDSDWKATLGAPAEGAELPPAVGAIDRAAGELLWKMSAGEPKQNALERAIDESRAIEESRARASGASAPGSDSASKPLDSREVDALALDMARAHRTGWKPLRSHSPEVTAEAVRVHARASSLRAAEELGDAAPARIADLATSDLDACLEAGGAGSAEACALKYRISAPYRVIRAVLPGRLDRQAKAHFGADALTKPSYASARERGLSEFDRCAEERYASRIGPESTSAGLEGALQGCAARASIQTWSESPADPAVRAAGLRCLAESGPSEKLEGLENAELERMLAGCAARETRLAQAISGGSESRARAALVALGATQLPGIEPSVVEAMADSVLKDTFEPCAERFDVSTDAAGSKACRDAVVIDFGKRAVHERIERLPEMEALFPDPERRKAALERTLNEGFAPCISAQKDVLDPNACLRSTARIFVRELLLEQATYNPEMAKVGVGVEDRRRIALTTFDDTLWPCVERGEFRGPEDAAPAMRRCEGPVIKRVVQLALPVMLGSRPEIVLAIGRDAVPGLASDVFEQAFVPCFDRIPEGQKLSAIAGCRPAMEIRAGRFIANVVIRRQIEATGIPLDAPTVDRIVGAALSQGYDACTKRQQAAGKLAPQKCVRWIAVEVYEEVLPILLDRYGGQAAGALPGVDPALVGQALQLGKSSVLACLNRDVRPKAEAASLDLPGAPATSRATRKAAPVSQDPSADQPALANCARNAMATVAETLLAPSLKPRLVAIGLVLPDSDLRKLSSSMGSCIRKEKAIDSFAEITRPENVQWAFKKCAVNTALAAYPAIEQQATRLVRANAARFTRDPKEIEVFAIVFRGIVCNSLTSAGCGFLAGKMMDQTMQLLFTLFEAWKYDNVAFNREYAIAVDQISAARKIQGAAIERFFKEAPKLFEAYPFYFFEESVLRWITDGRDRGEWKPRCRNSSGRVVGCPGTLIDFVRSGLIPVVIRAQVAKQARGPIRDGLAQGGFHPGNGFKVDDAFLEFITCNNVMGPLWQTVPGKQVLAQAQKLLETKISGVLNGGSFDLQPPRELISLMSYAIAERRERLGVADTIFDLIAQKFLDEIWYDYLNPAVIGNFRLADIGIEGFGVMSREDLDWATIRNNEYGVETLRYFAEEILGPLLRQEVPLSEIKGPRAQMLVAKMINTVLASKGHPVNGAKVLWLTEKIWPYIAPK